MNNPTYDLAFFRSFFSAIPEEKWTVYNRDDGQGHNCAVGHTCDSDMLMGCLRKWKNTDMTHDLIALFAPLTVGAPWGNVPIGVVTGLNNGIDPRYPQPTPRARILAAIDDLIAMEDAKLDAVEDRELIGLSANVEQPCLVS